MYSLIVLGQVPGTEIRLSFDVVLTLVILGLITYRFRSHLPKNKKVILLFNNYKKRSLALIVRYWNNVFSPKPKFLK